MNEERRRAERSDFNIPCQFETDGKDFSGYVANLSTGGICIRQAGGIPRPGSEIRVTLHLGPNYECVLKAKVVHIQPGRDSFGVEFRTPLEKNSEFFSHVTRK
jgi:hypothetical protein